jgi:2-polyprenyl-3-methyl-5-hydroxy-6-metoxy-1,4-benzoquinol methylase
MDSHNLADLYDAHYFAHGCGRPYQRDKGWLDFFGAIADRIVRDIQPGTVLDAGCAMGFLVEALRDRGVDSFGVDISEYVLQNVRQDIQPYCWLGTVTDPFPQKYDLIVCIEVLEHLPRREAEQAVANLCRHTDDILFCSTPFDYKEVTHFNVQPPEYWAELFAQQGFFRDVDFDASFILPWAVRLRRKTEPMARLVREYERRFWLLWKENTDLRDLTLEMRQQLAGGEELEGGSERPAELKSDLDWMREYVQRTRRRSWLDWVQDILSKLNRLGVLGQRPVQRLPSLAQPLSQTFIAEHGNLNSLTILVEAGAQPTLYPLQVTLTQADVPDKPIFKRIVSPRHLPVIGPLALHFSPLLESESQAYCLTFHLPQTLPGDTTALWGYLRSGRPGGELHWREHRLRGELVMSATYGAPEDPVADRWRLPCWTPRSPLALGALFNLARGILSGTQ